MSSGTPLQFQPVYVQSVATSFADRGFTVIDDLGTITLTGVSIVGDALVRLQHVRELQFHVVLIAVREGIAHVHVGGADPAAGEGDEAAQAKLDAMSPDDKIGRAHV